jgi:hypothetical protein
MSDTSADKIMGFIPKTRYTYFMYMLTLSGVGIGAVLAILGLVGVYIPPLNSIATILGLCGLVLALLGAFVFRADFSELDYSHFLYVSIVWAITWFAAVFLGSALAFVWVLAQVAVVVISLAAAVLIYTGYNSWKSGRTITKDNLQSEVRIALKRP